MTCISSGVTHRVMRVRSVIAALGFRTHTAFSKHGLLCTFVTKKAISLEAKFVFSTKMHSYLSCPVCLPYYVLKLILLL